MSEDVRKFAQKLCSLVLTEEKIIEEKLSRFMQETDSRLIALINHELFSNQYRLTNYLKVALENSPRASDPIRKKVINFIAVYIQTHHLYLVEHVKTLFSELLSHFWKEEGRVKEVALRPIVTIIEVYEDQFLKSTEVLNPLKLHNDIMVMLQTQKKSHGVVGECWHLLSVIQNKFTTDISASQKKKVQQVSFIELKKYVNQDSNLNTIAALLKALSKSLKESYIGEEVMGELYKYVVTLMMPLKATYSVPVAALELLETRKQLFQQFIMDAPKKLFQSLRTYANHKNKEFSLKSLEVLISIVQLFVKVISCNKQKYRDLFIHIREKINTDLSNHVNKNKDEPIPQDKKGLSLLTIIRLLGIMAPLYLQYQGKASYKKIFNYIIKKCTKRILRENNYQPLAGEQNIYEIKYILYAQKELKSFISALAQLIEQLDEIDYEEAGQLEVVLIEAVKESRAFLKKYKGELWEAMVQMIMSIHMKGTIFSKWAKKVISQSLKECLDSTKLSVTNDGEYIIMIERVAELWKSLLNHSSWRSGALNEFTQLLMANYEYLMLNLDCGYRIKNQVDDKQAIIEEEIASQEEGIVSIFFMPNERIEIAKIEDYQYLSSLSLLFNQILINIDPCLYSERLFTFYPLILERIKLYPKSLPLLRTLRTLNEFILKSRFFPNYMLSHKEYCKELLEKMKRFFSEGISIVFKYQEQYFYELLKILLSFSEEVYFLDNYRIVKSQLADLIIKTLEMGQEINSLADSAVRCLKRLFRAQKEVFKLSLSTVVPALEKYINVDSDSQKEQMKAHLFLSEQKITRQSISEEVLSFLGSLGGLCHLLVDSRNNDHISWDFDCHLSLQLSILNQKYTLNITKLLNRTCWLAINGRDEIKIVACQFLHAIISYVIEEVVSNKMSKDNLSVFLDRILPTVLPIAGNTSHPSQQLIHTLLIQTIHFFANTKQPNSPDIQVILKHLLSLYNKSEDMGFLASKCLSEFIRWHIKQQPLKNGDVPILKALMSNIWSLVGNKKAREGIITFLVKLLKIIHREKEIMSYYSLQLGFLIIGLARYNNKLQSQFFYLIQKYTACLKRYMKLLLIVDEGRKYKKARTIKEFLDWLYKFGFFSRYQQQREAALYIWYRVICDSSESIGYDHAEFLKVRANKEKKYLFGSTASINFGEIEENEVEKYCWRVVALGEIWLKMLEFQLFQEHNLVQFIDLECVYLVSFTSFLEFVLDQKNQENNIWSDQTQHSIISNFVTFLRLIHKFSLSNAMVVLGKFLFNLQATHITEETFMDTLFYIMYDPEKIIRHFNRDFLFGQDLNQYIKLFVNYQSLFKSFSHSSVQSPIDLVIILLQHELKVTIPGLVQFIAVQETSGERRIKLILSLIKAAYRHDVQHHLSVDPSERLEQVLGIFIEYTLQGKVRNERLVEVVQFLFEFDYEKVATFILSSVRSNNVIWQRFQKQILVYIQKNWFKVRSQVVHLSLQSLDHIKLIYVLIRKLGQKQSQYFLERLPDYPIKELFLRDLLKINFLLVQSYTDYLPSRYISYLESILEVGLQPEKPIQVHEQSLYLCALLLQKAIRLSNIEIKTLKVSLNTLGNKYCPYALTKLDTPQKQQTAMRYFSIVRNFIIISEEFVFIQQFFIELKDRDLKDSRLDSINELIEDCVRSCFTLESHKPRQWCEFIIEYFKDENIDKDQWCNFRFAVVDKILRKVMSYVKLELVQELFDKHILMLEKIIKKPLSNDSIKSLLLDFQVKKGALLMVQLLYGNLPRREKKEGEKPQTEIHKAFIKYCTEIVKKKLDEPYMKMIREHDQNNKDQHKKACKVYRQYNCYGYNCLIILFISTQSNKEHFKSFLFENNRQALWDNLVDAQQQEFGFEIETEFKVMKPYNPLRNKLNQIKSKISKNYFESSLYVVEEEIVPRTQLAKIEEEDEGEEEKEVVPVTNANNLMLNSQIEEDIINRHPCMVNLLRVVDYLSTTFPDPTPTWMKPIENYLSSYNISLAERILLIKLILNRPSIFNQSSIWACHLLNYLSLKQTGGKFIHYFYRDTLKRYIKFLPDLKELKPDISHINTVIMKLIRALPHDNADVYVDNVYMLEQLLNVDGVYVDKTTINKMLKGDEKDDSRNEWRLCAIIVLKLCISYKVPILSEDEYHRLRERPMLKYSFYYQHIKAHMKTIFDMAGDNGKKYRIAASGLLGEFLNFILCSNELSAMEKKEHFDGVSFFLNSLTDKKSNRTVKQRFSLALDKIAGRFPQIFADEKVFGSFEDGLIHYTGQERLQLLNAFKEYTKNVLSFNQTGKISNFFMILRVNWEKIAVDTNEVQLSLLQLLNLCTDPRVLINKDVLKTYSIILDHFHRFIHQNQYLAQEYFLIMINLKKFLTDRQRPRYDFCLSFLKTIEHNMVAGLTCKFQGPFNLLFQQFEKDVAELLQTEPIKAYAIVFDKIYTPQYEYLWLNNVSPLLLTLSKSSSDYKRLFTQTKLEENMVQYDWDFRNFRINDASLPYTPFSIVRKDNLSQKPGTATSQIPSNKPGFIRATQNNYLSQEEQIFTMLESLSPSLGQSPSQNEPFSLSEETLVEEQNRYRKINDLFQNRRKRNQLMDDFKSANQNKTSAAVKYVEDKIRFAKKVKVELKGAQLRSLEGKQKMKKGAILRAYKLGELPNIQVSLQNLVEPLIYLTSKDFQLSSEIFLQLMEALSSFSLKNCEAVKEILVHLLQSSLKYEFNFISTLQKGLIKMCQKHKKFFDISLKEITVHSNTLDYAILFTEENLIQGAIEIESSQTMEAVMEKKEKLTNQWSDLADYYQLLNEHDLIQSVIIKLLEGEDKNNIIKALKEKRQGDLAQAKKIFDELIIRGTNKRLNDFLNREKIDCTVLLSEWDQICKESSTRRQDGLPQSYEEIRMYTIALQNLEPGRRTEFLKRDRELMITGDRYEYERGILCVMKEAGIDGAKYHALNSRQMFRKEWMRVSSFAFNSKHEILQSLQKNYQLNEFVNLFKDVQSTNEHCKQIFSSWSSRHPDTIFDDNITWIQILSSRLLYAKLLADQHYIPPESMARSITQWHIQVVNGMLVKGVLGYAENMIRRALLQHKLTKEFNWQFYQSISKLKLLQLLKKSSLKTEEYSIVPKLIQKEMDHYGVNSSIDKFRLIMVKNEYFEGFLEVSLRKRQEMDYTSFVCKIIETFNNYEEVRKGLRSCEAASQEFKRQVHFNFAMFLQSVLSIIRGKFQIKEVKQSLDKNNYNIKVMATKFIEELVYSIKILNLNTYSNLKYEEGQQVFSMILKLIKILQSDYAIIGKYFEDAITDKQIPKWIFIYFVPQIIRNINHYDLSIHLKELFQYLLTHYPQALVYPFNCTYPRLSDCHTDLAKYLYQHLHQKMSKYFEFIDNLFLIQHPEMRLKDILTKYLSHGQFERAILELQEFIHPNPYLGKYNMRFNENYKHKISSIIDLKKRGLHKDVSELIRNTIASLDPSKCNMMKYFTKLSDGSLWFEEYNMSDWLKLEVPGITYNQLEQPLPWNKVFIQSFDNSILTLTSIRKPKRLSLLGSNEKIYMLLVKGGEDVRLDQRVEQLFELVNRILSHFPETNRKQLKISRFEVIPMKPMFGVFEWVDKSQTLRSFLQGELRKIKGKPELNLASENDAFTTFITFLNRIAPGGDKYNWHKALMMQPEEAVIRNMSKCENQLPYGLLRFALERLAKNYDSFLHIKNQFINNYSAICLITYIFGIGDRHLENFLIQTSTGSIVMIDFGYSFGASVELPIPELIPFRLTKTFIDLCKPIGIDGAFRKCLLACYEALYKKMQLIVDYCDVFVDDPLMQWVWVSRKQLANSSSHSNQAQVMVSGTGQSFSVSQQAPERKHFTNKIKMVENKLKGYNPRMILEQLLKQSKHRQANFMESLRKAIWGRAKAKGDILTGEELVNELLSFASDKNITGRSYIGLNLFV